MEDVDDSSAWSWPHEDTNEPDSIDLALVKAVDESEADSMLPLTPVAFECSGAGAVSLLRHGEPFDVAATYVSSGELERMIHGPAPATDSSVSAAIPDQM